MAYEMIPAPMRREAVKSLLSRILRNPKTKAVLVELGKDSLIAGTTWLGVQAKGTDAGGAADEFASAIAATSTYGEMVGALTTALAASKSDAHAIAVLESAEEAAGSDRAAQEFVASVRDSYYRARNTGDGQPGKIDNQSAPQAVKMYREMQINIATVKKAAGMLGMSVRNFAALRRAIHLDEDAFNGVLTALEG